MLFFRAQSTKAYTGGGEGAGRVPKNLFAGYSVLITWDRFKELAPVFNATRWINLYLVDNSIGFLNTSPLDGDLSGG